jgi:hypothetical protein
MKLGNLSTTLLMEFKLKDLPQTKKSQSFKFGIKKF